MGSSHRYSTADIPGADCRSGHACRCAALVVAIVLMVGAPRPALAQASTANAPASPAASYVVGPQDVLTITSYDQADLSGRFTVETDGTFTFPLIGRFRAGGLTLRQVEEGLKKRLKDEDYFVDPQVSVTVEQYRSQKVSIVGEVRSPGTYPLSGDMTLVEVLARAGSILPTASGEALVVRGGKKAASQRPAGADEDDPNTVRVDLRELEKGVLSQNASLRDGNTIFVPRAESLYVFGQVRNPGAYALQHERKTTVLQALSLAGGVTDRGSTTRTHIIRIVNGEKTEINVKLSDLVEPGDTIVVRERLF